jgi:hypothetical protein
VEYIVYWSIKRSRFPVEGPTVLLRESASETALLNLDKYTRGILVGTQIQTLIARNHSRAHIDITEMSAYNTGRIIAGMPLLHLPVQICLDRVLVACTSTK